MSLVDELSYTVLILIRAGAVCRIAYCFLMLVTVEEEAVQFRKRIRNTLLFYVLAESAFVLRNIFIAYFT